MELHRNIYEIRAKDSRSVTLVQATETLDRFQALVPSCTRSISREIHFQKIDIALGKGL